MNKLNQLLRSTPNKSFIEARKLLAEYLGVKEVTIRSMANGSRRITAENAVAIARFFNIKKSELRPDIFDD